MARRQSTQLMTSMNEHMSRPEIQKVANNWEVGLTRLVTGIKLKWETWLILPHKLASLGHHDQAEARKHMIICVDMYRQAGAGTRHHGLTLLLCDPDDADGLWPQLRMFLGGADREEDPGLDDLASLAGGLAMIRRPLNVDCNCRSVLLVVTH